MFSGLIVAIVTPFKNGKIDEKSFKKLVQFHLDNRTDGIVPCGTTGESATLSHAEHKRIIELTVKEADGKVPVIAGAGSNSTEETIELCKFSKKVGADGVLLVVPYYNKPSQQGLYQHFSRVAKSVKIPIILYNIPGRTGVNMLPETIIRLACDCKNIIGLKEATGDMDQASEVIRSLGENFDLLSGDDSLTLPLLSIGGKGVISVAANIIPREIKNMVKLWKKGDVYGAQQVHLRVFPLIKGIFLETNPVPVKTAMGILGMCSPAVRLPMAPMIETNKQKLISIIKEFGVKI